MEAKNILIGATIAKVAALKKSYFFHLDLNICQNMWKSWKDPTVQGFWYDCSAGAESVSDVVTPLGPAPGAWVGSAQPPACSVHVQQPQKGALSSLVHCLAESIVPYNTFFPVISF